MMQRALRSQLKEQSLPSLSLGVFLVLLLSTLGCDKTKQLGFSVGQTEGAKAFNGIAAIQLSSEGKYILVWNPSANSTDFSSTSYEIFMDRWQAEGGLPDAASLTSKGTETLPGSKIIEMSPSQTPASNGALIGSVKGMRSYTLSEKLQKGITYMFQVRSVTPEGERDSNNLVLFYNPDSRFYFAGLLEENVTVASDASKISLKWTAATGAAAAVKYVVYSDANFSQVISSTTATGFDYMKPIKGQTYTFAVRAFDGDTPDENKKFVAVSVPDPSDKTPPTFSGLVSATVASDKKIYLKWDASPSPDVAQYNVYFAHNLATAVASTSATSFLVSGLSAGTGYSFVVRAKDGSGNEDSNVIQKSATTLSYSVPDFAGLDLVSPVAGTAGLSSLLLAWSEGGTGTSGYKVYRSTVSGSFDFSAPIADITSASTTTYTAAGLSANTTYYFVVRAYNGSTSPVRTELNTVEKSNATLQIKAPTFSGVSTAIPGAGSLALTTAVISWGTPSSDGVFDGFVVQYEAGSCSSAFSGNPSEASFSGDATRTGTITGLTATTTYRVRVRSNYSVMSLRDTNTTCREVYTSPTAPTFSGITGLARAAGAAGFTTLTASWSAASGSFTYYKVEWATNASFSGATTVTPNITTIGTTSKTITGLPPKSNIYVRVSAVFDESGTLLSSGTSTSLSETTTPAAPTGEGPSTVQILAADSLKVNWTAPTNIASALYNGYKLWKYCGASAPSNLIAKLSGAADHTYGTGVLSATFTGLASNTECCYQVRAYYDDGVNTLTSSSTVTYQCKTPTLSPPTFAGVTSAANPNTSSGFTSLTVNWSAVDVAEAGLFSYYEIDWATTPTGQDWAGTIQVSNRTTTSTTITGLTENTTYYVRVRAVNNNGSPSVNSGSDAVASATTTPPTPTGDNLSLATSIASTKVQLTYTPPSSTVATGGLFNNVFLFVQAGTTSDVASYRTSVEAGGITSGEIQGQTSSKKITLTSVPAVIQIPYPGTEMTADIANQIELWGLTANQQICVQAVAAFWVNGQPTRYLSSNTPTTRCATPAAGAPTFAGVSSLTGFGDNRDFTQIIANFTAPTGDCTSIEVSAQTTTASPDWSTPTATASCSATSVTIGGRTPHTTYYIQVRAVNEVSGVKYAAGSGTELSRVTAPTVPSGDGVTSASITLVSKAADTAAVAWTNPTAGYWNKTFVWRASGSSLPSAQAAVRAAATTNAGKTGPVTSATAQYTAASATTSFTDTGLSAGIYYCWLVKGVYSDGTYYQASSNETTQCAIGAYSTPSFGGVASGAVVGTWSDTTAQIELTFNGTPSGSIEEYLVYYSPSSSLASFGDLTKEPWQRVTVGDATYDSDPNDNKILVGGNLATVTGTGYYLVRYKYYFGQDEDTNTAISTAVTVPYDQSNYVYIAPERSGLAYGYYMMQYEASNNSGVSGTDSVTTTEADLATCNYQFHVNGNATHSSCGSSTSTRTLKSVKLSVSWSDSYARAWWGCRRPPQSGLLSRLPTHEEWSRAAKWVGTTYTNLSTVYTDGTSSNCRFSGGATTSGSRTSCRNDLNIYDMGGNASEWVDSRMVTYDISAAGESRFTFGPTIGRTLANGIDNISRRFHLINPGASGLSLSMGAHGSSANLEIKAYGAQAQQWQDPSTTSGSNAGYRCMAFMATKVPTMSQLALPAEPTYSSADYAGGASTWTIPENLYANDTKAEAVSIDGPFPNTGSLAAWNFNNTSTSSLTVSDVYGSNNMTMGSSANWSLASGLNGTSYANRLSASITTSSGASLPFTLTDQFTLGMWIKFPSSSPTTVYVGRFASGSGTCNGSANTGTCGYFLYLSQSSIYLALGNGGSNTSILNVSGTSIADGNWHHVVVTNSAAPVHTLYIDGVQRATSTTAVTIGNPNGHFGFLVYQGGGTPADVQIGSLFYQGTTYYTAQDVNRLYQHGLAGNYMNGLSDYKINLTWKPWSKTVCNPSCTSSSTGMSYRIYRFIEPTRFSDRFAMPWALTGGTNPYTADKPLDPLLVDASNNPVYTTSTTDGKLIATISNCDSSNQANCTFSDGPNAGTGFSVYKLYNYIVVAVDADGNKQMAMTQRFRTQYLAGPAATSGAATFRLEPRYRRASVALVDEAYQQSQTRPQIMVHVPMDKSGLDHDFFIQKYEASSYLGSIVNNTPSGSQGSSEWPLQADASGVWKADAAKCYDKMNQTAGFDNICGSGTAVNGTTTTLQSKQGSTPVSNIDQGALWKACRNTGFSDEDTYTYYLNLPTDAEWYKASDWGDPNHDGTIDIGANSGVNVATLEWATADTTTVRCHTDVSPNAAYSTNSSQTSNCRSRYGAADMVGNMWEWALGQELNGVGYDNGSDGMWLGFVHLTSSGLISSFGGNYDFFRGVPRYFTAASIATNGDQYWYSAGMRGSFRGTGYQTGSTSGRFSMSFNSPPTSQAVDTGGRCRR